MNLYEYRVEYYSDLDDKEMVDYGYLIAENYSDGINILCSWYGDKDIDSLKLDYINDKPLLTLGSMFLKNDERPVIMDIINDNNSF